MQPQGHLLDQAIVLEDVGLGLEISAVAIRSRRVRVNGMQIQVILVNAL